MFSVIKTCKKDPLKKSASKIPKVRGSEAFGKNPYLSHLIYFESFPKLSALGAESLKLPDHSEFEVKKCGIIVL